MVMNRKRYVEILNLTLKHDIINIQIKEGNNFLLRMWIEITPYR